MKTVFSSMKGLALPNGTHLAIPNEVYQADPCGLPSLSAGIAHTLITQSPLHAWFAHPRLNPEPPADEPSNEMDYGAAVHALALEGREDAIAVIRAKDYRTADAKAARDVARAENRIPVLEAKVPQVYAMREALLRAIRGNPDLRGIDFADGHAESVDVWAKGGIVKRSRPDWRHNDRRTVIDLKTTKASANPDAWTRTMLGMGSDIQAVHYLEGNEETGGPPADEARFIFAVQEQEPPHAVAFVGLPPEFIEFSRAKYAEACRIWRECMESGEWVGYPNRVCWVEIPGWAQYAWENRVPASMMAESSDTSHGMEGMYGDIRREKEAGNVH